MPLHSTEKSGPITAVRASTSTAGAMSQAKPLLSAATTASTGPPPPPPTQRLITHGTVEQTVDRLFLQNTVEELISYKVSLQNEAAAADDAMRAAIGSRYRELLATCDEVVGMDAVCATIQRTATRFKAHHQQRRHHTGDGKGGGGGRKDALWMSPLISHPTQTQVQHDAVLGAAAARLAAVACALPHAPAACRFRGEQRFLPMARDVVLATDIAAALAALGPTPPSSNVPVESAATEGTTPMAGVAGAAEQLSATRPKFEAALEEAMFEALTFAATTTTATMGGGASRGTTAPAPHTEGTSLSTAAIADMHQALMFLHSHPRSVDVDPSNEEGEGHTLVAAAALERLASVLVRAFLRDEKSSNTHGESTTPSNGSSTAALTVVPAFVRYVSRLVTVDGTTTTNTSEASGTTIHTTTTSPAAATATEDTTIDAVLAMLADPSVPTAEALARVTLAVSTPWALPSCSSSPPQTKHSSFRRHNTECRNAGEALALLLRAACSPPAAFLPWPGRSSSNSYSPLAAIGWRCAAVEEEAAGAEDPHRLVCCVMRFVSGECEGLASGGAQGGTPDRRGRGSWAISPSPNPVRGASMPQQQQQQSPHEQGHTVTYAWPLRQCLDGSTGTERAFSAAAAACVARLQEEVSGALIAEANTAGVGEAVDDEETPEGGVSGEHRGKSSQSAALRRVAALWAREEVLLALSDPSAAEAGHQEETSKFTLWDIKAWHRTVADVVDRTGAGVANGLCAAVADLLCQLPTPTTAASTILSQLRAAKGQATTKDPAQEGHAVLQALEVLATRADFPLSQAAVDHGIRHTILGCLAAAADATSSAHPQPSSPARCSPVGAASVLAALLVLPDDSAVRLRLAPTIQQALVAMLIPAAQGCAETFSAALVGAWAEALRGASVRCTSQAIRHAFAAPDDLRQQCDERFLCSPAGAAWGPVGPAKARLPRRPLSSLLGAVTTAFHATAAAGRLQHTPHRIQRLLLEALHLPALRAAVVKAAESAMASAVAARRRAESVHATTDAILDESDAGPLLFGCSDSYFIQMALDLHVLRRLLRSPSSFATGPPAVAWAAAITALLSNLRPHVDAVAWGQAAGELEETAEAVAVSVAHLTGGAARPAGMGQAGTPLAARLELCTAVREGGAAMPEVARLPSLPVALPSARTASHHTSSLFAGGAGGMSSPGEPATRPPPPHAAGVSSPDRPLPQRLPPGLDGPDGGFAAGMARQIGDTGLASYTRGAAALKSFWSSWGTAGPAPPTTTTHSAAPPAPLVPTPTVAASTTPPVTPATAVTHPAIAQVAPAAAPPARQASAPAVPTAAAPTGQAMAATRPAATPAAPPAASVAPATTPPALAPAPAVQAPAAAAPTGPAAATTAPPATPVAPAQAPAAVRAPSATAVAPPEARQSFPSAVSSTPPDPTSPTSSITSPTSGVRRPGLGLGLTSSARRVTQGPAPGVAVSPVAAAPPAAVPVPAEQPLSGPFSPAPSSAAVRAAKKAKDD